MLYLAPLSLTLYTIYVIFLWGDGLINSYIIKYVGFDIPGLGLIIVMLFITLIGYIGTTILFNPILILLDKFISQAPLVKIIYSSIKDIMGAFVGKDKKFTEPVLVKIYEGSNLEKLGFVTQKDLTSMGIDKDMVAVYLPLSYTFSGNLFIVPTKNVRPIKASPTEVMKFIISAGVTSIPHSSAAEVTGEETPENPTGN
ncbi:MAG TPA: DUF502 domain-containing protein [Bacteroidales bacterium]